MRRLAARDTSAATLSAGGGSKSYTLRDLDQLKAREHELIALIAEIYRGGKSLVTPIYCQ